ncbi:YraN family protein [Candidatus Peregrinibacteria bacterium]|jgi:putative endonuclease|nr:YraN family protein [Candidatus Peregrinibacteria bacterium]MBT4056018.1 YraN family protein [Candidatus Peregrinibacteria bacterium]
MYQKKLGNLGENIAKNFLIKTGHKILAQNYYSKYGEIDLIAENQNEIEFIEVRTRTTRSINNPEETLTYQKTQRIIKTALTYLEKTQTTKSWRITFIGILLDSRQRPIEINHIPIL